MSDVEKKPKKEKRYHEFLQDINLDFDQKTLGAFVVGVVTLILSCAVCGYGLGHHIESEGLIGNIILGLIGFTGGLLGVTAFAKQRKKDE